MSYCRTPVFLSLLLPPALQFATLGWEGLFPASNFATEQAYLYLIKRRLPWMCTLITLCFCGRRGLLVLLSAYTADCNDGLQKNKEGSEAPALASRNGSMHCSWLERAALLSTVAVCVSEPSSMALLLRFLCCSSLARELPVGLRRVCSTAGCALK